jgi:hypothetical protein
MNYTILNFQMSLPWLNHNSYNYHVQQGSNAPASVVTHGNNSTFNVSSLTNQYAEHSLHHSMLLVVQPATRMHMFPECGLQFNPSPECGLQYNSFPECVLKLGNTTPDKPRWNTIVTLRAWE